MKKNYKSILALLFFVVVAALPLLSFSLTKYNFWMDYNGNFNLLQPGLGPLINIWSDNFFGASQFAQPSNLILLFYIKIIYRIFGLPAGTFFVFYFINFGLLLAGWFLSKTITKNNFFAAAIAPVFIFSPVYMFYELSTGTLSFLFSAIGMVLSLAFLNRYWDSGGRRNIFLIALSFLLIVQPVIFILFSLVVFFVIALTRKLKDLLVFVASLIGLSLFWIQPFLSSFVASGSNTAIIGDGVSNVKDVLDGLSGSLQSFLFSIRGLEFLQGFTFSSLIITFIVVIWGLFILSLSRNLNNKKAVAFAIPTILLFLFSLGGSRPFGLLFDAIWKFFPFVHFFRSYTHAVFIVYFLLVFFLLLFVFTRPTKKITTWASLAVFILIVSFTFSGKSFPSHKTSMPIDYLKVQEIVAKDKGDFLLFRLPYTKYDYYEWDESGKDKYFLQFFFDKGIIYNGPGQYVFENEDSFLGGLYRDIYSGKSKISDLGQYNIKYVLVQNDLKLINSEYFRPLPPITDPGLAKVIYSTENLELYQIDDSEITSAIAVKNANILVEKKNNWHYVLRLEDIKDKEEIEFLRNENTGWKLIPRGGKSFSLFGSPLVKENNETYLWNRWIVDPKTDKSTVMDLVFWPQIQFYFFLALSSLFLLGLLVYIFRVKKD